MLDTNIVLYLLSGDETVAELIQSAQCYVSCITELELLSYKGITSEEIKKVKQFLSDCIIIDLSSSIKEHVIKICRQNNMKLPDSIVAATSMFLQTPLLTSDKGFKKLSSLSLFLYEV